jgi:nucleoid-associated protein YgaU
VAALSDLRSALAGIGARREHAAAAADSLDRLADSLSARVAEARSRAPAVRARSSYTVRPGDCLWRIAADDRGYGDGRAWRRIYEANRGVIRDPDLIYPGQEFQIPR